jgi:cytochrome P450
VRWSNALGGFWLVTGYDEVNQVLLDTRRFSSANGIVLTSIGTHATQPPIEVDPPTQREWRRLLNPYLAPAAIGVMEGPMRGVAQELIRQFKDRGTCELMDEFAEPFPAYVLGRVLRIDDDERLRHLQLSNHRITHAESPEAIANAYKELRDHCVDLVQERRRSPLEGDIVTGIVSGTIEGEPVTEGEAVAAVMLLHLGGLDTVSDAIGSIAFRLAQTPELRSILASPPLLSVHLDEFLRLDPPITALARAVTEDLELSGQHIKAGDRVYVHYGSANRDEATFPNAGVLDFERSHYRHVTFGRGPHRCAGSYLARMELAVAFDELLKAVGDIAIANDGNVEWKYGTTFGPAVLPLQFTATSQ